MQIIIQQTRSGLEIVYNSNNNSTEHLNFFLRDERFYNTFNISSDNYSYSTNNNNKCYSLISTEIKDKFNTENSFFAIRIILDKNEIIENAANLLLEIKERYISHYNNNSLANLSFINLNIKVFKVNLSNVIYINTNNDAYITSDELDLNKFFYIKNIELFNTVYYINKEKNRSFPYDKIIPFKNIKFRSIQIDPNNLLQSLKVNDTEINYPNNSNSFELITTTDSIVSYKKSGKKEFLNLNQNQNSLVLERENITIPKTPGGSKSGSQKTSVGPILLYTVLTISVLGVLGWLSLDLFKPKDSNNIYKIETQTPQIIDNTKNEVANNQEVEFAIISKDQSEKRYKVINPKKLENFEFIYNSGWSYDNKNTPTVAVDFSEKNIEDIFNTAKVTFNENIKQNFITELEKISGKKISKKTDENIKSEVNNGVKPKSTKKTVKTPENNLETKERKGNKSSEDDDQIEDK